MITVAGVNLACIKDNLCFPDMQVRVLLDRTFPAIKTELNSSVFLITLKKNSLETIFV